MITIKRIGACAAYFFRRAIPHGHDVAHLQQVRDDSAAHQSESEEAYPVRERKEDKKGRLWV